MKKSPVSILFPGRHHLLTKYQRDYLSTLANRGIDGHPVEQILFAVTSANHENTRRNPVPLYLRALAIDAFAAELPCPVRMYPIPDVPNTNRFAQYIISQIAYQSGKNLTPKNTVLACSTPNVIAQFKRLGFRNFPVELILGRTERYRAKRPYEIVDLLVRSGRRWPKDRAWRALTSEATQHVYDAYVLGDLILELFRDSLLNEDASITDTRDYTTYAQAMDTVMKQKFADIHPFVIEGKIVDVGCSTGSLIQLLAEKFQESDIIGIEATRKFYEFARMQEYAHPFVFFYRRNVTDQNFKENTINTFIYSSVMHEVFSYLGERTLHRVLDHTYRQLAYGGRMIIRDVVGPEHPHQRVAMVLRQDDGGRKGPIEKLSTYEKFFQFVKDFQPRRIHFTKKTIDGRPYIILPLRDAYEYLSKMTYTDNWASEMHETFGFYSFSQWQKVLRQHGFTVVAGSKSFQNEYIIDTMYQPRASLFTIRGKRLHPLTFPPTNMILVGKKERPN